MSIRRPGSVLGFMGFSICAANSMGEKEKVIYAGSLPASSLGQNEFAMRHPLMEIIEDGDVSKFEDGKKLDPEVCDYFLRQAILEMRKFSKCYAVEGSVINEELNYRPIVCSLLTVFTSLAPAAGELLEGELLEGEDSKDVPAGFEKNVEHVEMKTEPTQADGGMDSFMLDGTDLSGWSFVNDTFSHEDGRSLKPREAVVVRGYIVDTAILHSPRLTRSLFEMKAENRWPLCVYQTLYYGCGAGMQNVKAGRFKTVYLVVLGIGWAGVAEIDPVARLQVGNDNSVTDEAIARFRKDVEGKCEYLEKLGDVNEAGKLKEEYLSKKTDPELKAMLEEVVKDRIEAAATHLNARAPADTVYKPVFKEEAELLVGKASYRSLSYAMLRFPLAKKAKVADDRTVVSGVARIVCGDRALNWKLQGVLALAAKRREAASRLHWQRLIALCPDSQQ